MKLLLATAVSALLASAVCAEDIGVAPFEPDAKNVLQPGMEAEPLSGLKDRAVIGEDSRVHLRNTTDYPFRTMGLIGMEFGDGSGICTGTLVGDHYVLTAGHCVYDSDSGEFADKLLFFPGRDGDTVPYGAYGVSAAYMFEKYINANKVTSSGDIALLKLRDPAGDDLGWMGMKVASPIPEKVWANIARLREESDLDATAFVEKLNKEMPDHALKYDGYSGDKNLEPWGDECIYEYKPGDEDLQTYCDGQGGSSGSGIYDSSRYVVAVISNTGWDYDAMVTSEGYVYGDVFSASNHAAAINSDVMQQLKRWLKDDYGSETRKVTFSDDDNLNFVTVQNACYKSIYVALRYEDPDDGWRTDGFWEFNAGEKKRLIVTNADHLYYYAESTDGENEWSGDDSYGTLYGEEYGMRKRSIDTEYQLKLTCD